MIYCPRMVLKLITFDVTGTLVALREPVGQQYAKIGSLYGIHASPDILSKQFYCVFKKMLVDYPNFGENTIGWPEWWKQLVRHTFQSSLSENISVQSSEMNKITSDLIEVYKTKECWKLAEDAQSLLDKLASKNMHLGVISNYDPRLEDILNDLNIRKYFNFVLTSYNAKCQKPDSAIFKLVEDMNIDIKKTEMLHIGDNPKLDFMGAKNVGWNALLIAENFTKLPKDFPDIQEDWVVQNVGEIYSTLEHKKLL